MTKLNIADALHRHIATEGYVAGCFYDGYDIEDGKRYAKLLNGFLRDLGITKWTILMSWGFDTSILVAERPLGTNDAGFYTSEWCEVPHVLDDNQRFDELVDDFAELVLKLAKQSEETPRPVVKG